ncbi:hypothetical protein [Kutzneria chonburiensis]|uniref:Uncharacterized protein n=1 Tax=Kutzneria chonburiensis TaxID=1483604 RepID=A0ABV6N803_9PSEU|nr:hypothetical protein [Kutzneria chonburiensis]
MRLAATVVAALGIVAAVAGTASAAEPTGITFWQADFSGQSVTYTPATTACVTLPYAVHSELNASQDSFRLYTTPDCTGFALTIPATDLHSFVNRDVHSFALTRD